MSDDEIALRIGRDVLSLREALADLKHLSCKRRQIGEGMNEGKRLLENPSDENWRKAESIELLDRNELFKLVRKIEETEKRIADLRAQFADLFPGK